MPWILLLTWVGGCVSKQEEKPKIKGRRKVRNHAEMGPDEMMKSGWSKWRRESCVRIINEWWGVKTEENQEENNHSGMKGAAWVSLWCTKQSQAERLALHLSVYLGKRKKQRSGGGRKREREGEVLEREQVKLVIKKKKKKIVLTHTGQSPARSQTKKDNKDGKVFTLSKAPAALM